MGPARRSCEGGLIWWLNGWTLYLVMMTAPFSWAACMSLVIWQAVTPGIQEGGGIVITGAGAVTGSICYAMRRYRPDIAATVLQAVLASRRRPGGPGLSLVETEAGPAPQPPRQSAG